MRVTKAELDAYTDALLGQQEAAKAFVEASIEAYAALNPRASVAELRDYAIQVMEQAYRTFGDAGAAVAAAWYWDLARRIGADVEEAASENSWDPAAVEAEVRYQAGKLAAGDVAGFAAALASKAYDHALFAANDTAARNADRDFDRGMRWARVPTGRTTCGFCVMLASRGFAYRTRESAGGVAGSSINTYHAHCDCRVVPGDASTVVDGYDPDWLYEVYSDAKATVEGQAQRDWQAMSKAERAAYGSKRRGGYDHFLRNRVCAEINRRDVDWVYKGKTPEVRYGKPRASLLPHEMAGVDGLAAHGLSITTIPEDPKAKANLDLVIGGQKWEMKNVSNARGSVSNQMARIRKKWAKLGLSGGLRGVITCVGCEAEIDDVCAGVELRAKAGDEFIVLKEEQMRRVKG